MVGCTTQANILISGFHYSFAPPEPGQINPWEEVGVARHPWVDLVVREDHGVHLDVLDLVRVVADHAGKLHPPDFVQLEGKGL